MLWPIAAILGAMYLMSPKTSSQVNKGSKNPMDAKYEPIRKIIVAEAKKQGVPPHVALAFAWLESRFDPNAAGDKEWHKWENGARYKKYVLANPTFAKNPYRNTPTVWFSYGLFQLLSPYFTKGNENPNVLFDPVVNAERGIKKIANSLKKANGNVANARIIYAGAANLSNEKKKEIVTKILNVLPLFPTNL